jgi:hypothetical protein
MARLTATVASIGLMSCQKDHFANYAGSWFERDSGYSYLRVDTVHPANFGGNQIAVVYYSIDSMNIKDVRLFLLVFFRDGEEVLVRELKDGWPPHEFILEPLSSGTYRYKICLRDYQGNRSRYSNEMPLTVP